ncbi:MAG: hypothetical protein V3U82_04520 [Robiginitomaculum sp.]
MSAPDITIDAKAAPILPVNSRADRPLFFVLMIMVFLACLSAIAAHASYRAAHHWGADLRASATVQIKPASGQDGVEMQIRTVQIAQTIAGIDSAAAVDDAQARALLRPWLGDVTLPADLPIPHLVELSLSDGEENALNILGQALEAAAIPVDIDDHQRWGADIRRATKAVQITASLALILLVGGAAAVAGFATQSGMSARRIIIDVLEQVGAAPHYIARLFVIRFGKLGLMAGAAGALGAAIMALLFWLMTGRGRAAMMPSFTLDKTDMAILIIAPVFAAIICAVAAGLTALSSLKSEAQ